MQKCREIDKILKREEGADIRAPVKTMRNNENACLVCGKPLQYFTKPKTMTCHFCGREFQSYACCEDGHFVCDDCHSKKGIEAIIDYCLRTDSSDPIRIVQDIMEDPYIYMHGPEHHTMVGAALLTAYHNAGGALDLNEALREMHERGKQYPGGSCGFWGCCGAAVSVGMFVSIITGTTPLSSKTWGYSNEATARALADIASCGGPRCCKRNSFTAILAAAAFTAEKLGTEMDVLDKVVCTFSAENHECLGKRCPYHSGF